MRVLRALAVVLALGSVGAAVACGPSFQAIYEGNARFEHCYALEENAQTLVPEKADCWRDWSERYTYGQTRDRIHYATARYVALSQASNVPTDEAMMMAAPGMTPRQSTITAPSPTNAFAPPPKVLDEVDASPGRPPRPSEVPVVMGERGASVDASAPGASAGDGGSPSGAAGPGAAVLPAADCSEGCATKFRECRDTCSSAEVAPGATTCTACAKSYKGCMRGCFK